jgi:hypothetical protein
VSDGQEAAGAETASESGEAEGDTRGEEGSAMHTGESVGEEKTVRVSERTTVLIRSRRTVWERTCYS